MNDKLQTVDGAALTAVAAPAPLAGMLNTVRGLGPGRIVALGGVALAMFAFFAFVILRAGTPSYTLLFAGLDLADSQTLVERLDAMAVPYRLADGGDAIMVPADRVLSLRMSLAEEGLPVGDTIGNELLDRAATFGTSDFLANINLRRALEGELARTIGTLRHVRSARVHLVQPRREPFQRDALEPTASIVLALSGTLDPRQIDGIRQLVAAAVPGLAVDAVTLVDDGGKLLGGGRVDEGPNLAESEDRRSALEGRLKARIVQLLERSVGTGKVDAEVSIDMDFDDIATTSEVYDPEGQVVRSTRTSEEQSALAEKQADDPVGVAGNLPTERVQSEAAAGSSNEQSTRTEETVNYEITRRVTNQTRRGGVVRRMSIAVQVDGLYQPQADGSSVFSPRDAAELEQLAALVRSAAGVDEGRGDVVEIVSRPFVVPVADDDGELVEPWLDREGYWRATELAVFATVSLAVLFFGVRPFLRRLLTPAIVPSPIAESTAVIAGADGRPLLVHGATGATVGVDDSGNPVLVREPVALPPPSITDARSAEPLMVDVKNVEGRVRAALIEDVAQIVEDRTDDAVRVLRSWLSKN